jgi:hypothetical protein
VSLARMQRATVFIHANRKQRLGALVSAHSLKGRANAPDAVDLQILWAEEHPFIAARDGQLYLRGGRKVFWVEDDLQSFTPLRFEVPRRMGYAGRAVVIDPDVFAVGDVCELLGRDMAGHAVLAKSLPATGRRPLRWASSVMLLDCARLPHWRCEEDFGRLFAFERDYLDWLGLAFEPPGTIGELETEWNHFDTLDATTKLLHNTRRRTQPWKTGLPVDLAPRGRYRGPRVFSRLAHSLSRHVGLRGRHTPHPDPAQERFFVEMLRTCLAEGVIARAVVEEEIQRRHVRGDMLDLVARATDGDRR